jgi:L-glyceraldehyde reductase
MSSGRTFKLNSGYTIPAVGLGTWQSGPNEVARAVEFALKHGYRHIDAAATYDNEAEVGAGIKASGVPRQDFFLTSKLWNTHHAGPDVEEAVDQSLKDLGTDYLDLYLIHWPVSFKKGKTHNERFPIDPRDEGVYVVDVPIKETWQAMEALVKKGKLRSIGISNFNKEKTEEILAFAEIKPAVNQIEAHPFLQQPEFLEWNKQQGILITAYSPSGNNIYNLPKAIDDATVIEVANSLGKTPAQVLIQWAVQRGTVVLPKSVTPSRIAENFEDFEVPQDAMEKIDKLDKNHRYNMPARLGVNVFGEHTEEFLNKSRNDWIAKQRELKAVA